MLLLGDLDRGLRVHRASLPVRLAVRLNPGRLDRPLARGTAPETSAALALRAYSLARPALRRDLAGRLDRILAEASRPLVWSVSACVPVRREQVRQSAPLLLALIERLRAPGPLPARGVAAVILLLSDGSGPPFGKSCTRSLSVELGAAIAALDPLGHW